MRVMSDVTRAAPTQELREERKVVTVLFADLVGSTALGERLDPEEVKLVVGEAVGRIVADIDQLGGHVKDLAGDGVLAFFGAPVSYEDDAERALRAALRIVEEIDTYGDEVERGWGVPGFGVRIGVTTGPVVLGEIGGANRVEYAAFGDTVNTAARLQASAEPGTVLVDDATRRQAEPLFAWGEPVELELKGKTERVRATGVERALAGGRKVRGLEGVEARLVGRERELGLAQAALERTLGGSGGVLFISGDAGIGKSRLVGELCRVFEESETAAAAAPLWLEGRCISYGESLPYWPFRDLLRDWLGVGADEPELRVRIALRRRVEALFPQRAGELYPYLGSLLGLTLEAEAVARLAELSPEALQYRTFEVVEELFRRLAEERPVAVAIEDLHWADPTSIQLVERLVSIGEEAAVLLVVAQRSERDHPSWRLRELAAREYPHLASEVALEPLPGDAQRELLLALVGEETLPEELKSRLLEQAEGNPFYLEELIRSLADTGALVHENGGWRFDHEVEIEIPPTVEKVLLARIDRLPAEPHEVLTAASALGRTFGLPLLEGVLAGNENVRASLNELQRLDLVREGRRWPQPEYRFKHALTQEAAYRTMLSEPRRNLHRRAAEWLERRRAEGEEEEALGLLAYHWLAAEDEEKAVAYLSRAGDRAREEYALDEAVEHYRALLPLLERRGERQEMAVVLFKLALALHTALRFAEANETYQRAFEYWTPSASAPAATETLRMVTSFLPNDPDPNSAIAWPNIQLCMQLFDRLVEAQSGRTLVPSLAERWEISDDGLRYVFHLREGLTWSDGRPLTAHDVEYGVKRVLNPASPGSSVAIYFVLENGQDYYVGRNDDADRIGVRALDDRTVEFRLAAPAPYFMSVMNRPDAGPQPRHAIERHGADWTLPENQVVSGPFAIASRTDEELVLERRPEYDHPRPGNAKTVRFVRSSIADALPRYDRGEAELIMVRYTPRLADLMPGDIHPDAALGPAAWSAYIRFDHTQSPTSNLDLRRALAHATDREALSAACPANLIVATGGVVPPALQGHTPEIALRYDPDAARDHLARSGFDGELELAGMEVWEEVLATVAASWQDVFGGGVSIRTWSWRSEEAMQPGGRVDEAPMRVTGWFPGYPDPEYYLRLLFQSDSRTNEGGFSHAPFDELIEQARRERDGRARLELFHEADRMAVAEQVACIPLVYGRNVAYVKPYVDGWWEFGKSSASFADLVVER
jgi:ABC-type oligopeptide transport system substrate-binding subunit/class 3 adenylate cyclase